MGALGPHLRRVRCWLVRVPGNGPLTRQLDESWRRLAVRRDNRIHHVLRNTNSSPTLSFVSARLAWRLGSIALTWNLLFHLDQMKDWIRRASERVACVCVCVCDERSVRKFSSEAIGRGRDKTTICAAVSFEIPVDKKKAAALNNCKNMLQLKRGSCLLAQKNGGAMAAV